jgi:feruloyl esterase
MINGSRLVRMLVRGTMLCGFITNAVAEVPGGKACAALVGSKAFAQTQVTSATWYAASKDLPPNCDVKATIRPEKGSEIGVVYRLPLEWNGKLLALGGGGWQGNVALETARDGLNRGYATLQTDGGHANGTGFDASPWALNPNGSTNKTKLKDFSYRAIHLMTERGKQLIAAYYGKGANRAYYQGCSTGGRMGLMEVQRYPADFDGVIAGAPVYTLQTQTSQQLRTVAFGQQGARLTAGQLTTLHKAVLAACDADDGAADGVLRDPRACDFDPAALQCADGQSGDSCLATAQVAAVRRVYAGEKTPAGDTAAYPLEKGSENDWSRFVPSTGAGDAGTNSGGLYALRWPLLANHAFDITKFSAADVPTVRSSWLAGIYEAKDPDISAFTARGGKLLMYHGFNDPGPGPRATIEYFEAALQKTRQAREATRLFLAPGMAHCRGGDGPDQVDWLGALDSWVEKGTAPEELPATKAKSSLAWNLCAYPKLPTGQSGGTYSCKVGSAALQLAQRRPRLDRRLRHHQPFRKREYAQPLQLHLRARLLVQVVDAIAAVGEARDEFIDHLRLEGTLP